MAAVTALISACAPAAPVNTATSQHAEAFIDSAEAVLYDLGVRAERASWVQSNFITHDTEILAAEASERAISASVALAKEAATYQGLDLPYDVERRLRLLRLSISNPAPSDPARTAELTRILARLESTYGRGEYCPASGPCLDIGEITRIMATSRNPAQLLDVWTGWHTISTPMREDYQRFVTLANAGARELGFDDLGTLWRSDFELEPDAFAQELDRLWDQVRPLYDGLQCHVRAKLGERYGADVVPQGEAIPAHLLGNIWAQDWSNIYDLVAPPGADPGYDLTAQLRAKGLDALEMVRFGERFFTSLGFEPLPATFWERSLFTQPRDRNVVCHASAWNLDEVDDLRIKMCIDVTAEDFETIHHELGHNFYQRAYNELPYLYRTGANDGFHEAIGDAIALSVTPSYLVRVGLLDREPGPGGDLGLLMRDALDKVAFLPFGLLIDQWRWQVFSGEVKPERYNQSWWELREKYQGVKAASPRGEEWFDAGAKFHVPANVSYSRYFLAHILQFQFHRALCEAAGHEGPLHRCSIYGNEEAGKRLRTMLELGRSRPWPEALEQLTGKREMDATAILDYFAPLKEWLDEQNQGRKCGWG
jgi:peptidyl-dipeptidase A